jgi:AcrR family transcriptional regulator
MSPRTAKQFEEIREEKRTLIMDVALELFASNGFHATTINQIARQAGISKGLLYNYFKSKEDLLSEIIRRSITDVYLHAEPDREGTLTEKEFVSFIRKVTSLLREKRFIWRLFFQMMMQKEVREYIVTDQTVKKHSGGGRTLPPDEEFIPGITAMISEYFLAKKKRKPAGYDPELEMNMFLMTLKGFATTFIYTDFDDEVFFNKTVNNIIELYK